MTRKMEGQAGDKKNWPVAEEYLTVDMLAENMPGAFLIYRASGSEEILFASRELIRIFECDSMEDFIKFTGGSFLNLVYPEDIEKVNRVIHDQVSATNGYDYVRYRVITKNGRIKNIEDWGHRVRSEKLNEDVFYVYLCDMQHKNDLLAIGDTGLEEPSQAGGKKTEDSTGSIPEQYGTDELTGLASLRCFRAKAPDFIRKFLGEGRHAYCVYFNIRNFHTYNETYGFAGGDRMLKSIARILQETFPDGLVSRFGDDHFAVITPQEDLKEKITRMGVRINNIRRGVIVEMKAGIYQIKDIRMDISLICDCAKLACDSIKREYGTMTQMYDGKMDEKVHLQEHILNTFESAMASGHIKVFFQPVVDVGTGKVASAEALTRWEDPSYGTLSPANFIYVLEEQHQIHKLDSFVIKKVCEELRRRKDAGEEAIPVSLNLSRLDFELTDIVKVIEEAALEYGIEKDLLRFEITESLIAMDMDALKHESDRLRKHGFKVWMDAFGSGYSSLRVLKDFTLDGLKIDMDMIRSYDDKRANIIISAVIDMAKRLGIPALSKGVETPEQLAFLKQAGCDLAQGYLFGKPAPAPRAKANR